ncbi:cold shock protein (beta-ribbon, CspA family) [Rhizobium multihospitium]|uniref:Cold shock protein (Beta-ribbon, CspA family) n=1 Tax=Rhizobium multihospitium TaxID=410764 RepID=A0A1C3XBJ4_9HYPH|nr:cold-shock protein [Rhizobium multihospitium]SCB49579.1 cold shock protein (beta-ribbon, CspA family) [Rhizobium multihospitium]
MPVGTIKFFNNEKGFGFIAPDNGETDVFVHISALQSGGALEKGTKVEYDLGEDRRTGRTRPRTSAFSSFFT